MLLDMHSYEMGQFSTRWQQNHATVTNTNNYGGHMITMANQTMYANAATLTCLPHHPIPPSTAVMAKTLVNKKLVARRNDGSCHLYFKSIVYSLQSRRCGQLKLVTRSEDHDNDL